MMPGAGPLPNVFVVGDAKCGTTSLHRVFELAPRIGTPRTRKELHWFSAPELVAATAGPGDDEIPPAIVHTEAEYRAEFAHLPPDLPVIADVSPSYLRNPGAARRLHAFAPEARIVILLREPAAKVFSQYVHLWSAGRETLPFEEAFARSAERRAAGFSDMFDYEGGGYYAAAVARYRELFGPDRVLVVLFEEMTRDMGPVRAALEDFLGVPLPASDLPQTNAGGRARSPLVAALLGNERLKEVAAENPAARPAHASRHAGARRGGLREAGAPPGNAREPPQPLRRGCHGARDPARPADRLALTFRARNVSGSSGRCAAATAGPASSANIRRAR